MKLVRMSKRLLLLVFWGIVCSPVAIADSAPTQLGSVALVPQTNIHVYFTPGDSPELAIVEQLRSARRSILVQAYSFTNPVIASALVDARKQGVNVVVLLDKSQRSQKNTAADFIANAGISTFIDDRHAIAHNLSLIHI